MNSQVDYDTAVLDYLRTTQVQQTHDGTLKKLDHTFPVGARVVRRMGQYWSAGIGFVFSEAERQSTARASYAYTVVDPRAQEYQRSFSETITVDPFMLRTRAYLPHALLRYDRTLWRRLRVGTSLDAGWLFANGRIERTRTGRWRGTIPTVGNEGSPATMNLSGWQVRLGIAVGL